LLLYSPVNGLSVPLRTITYSSSGVNLLNSIFNYCFIYVRKLISGGCAKCLVENFISNPQLPQKRLIYRL
jgi:predicted TIM-barrel enzyme